MRTALPGLLLVCQLVVAGCHHASCPCAELFEGQVITSEPTPAPPRDRPGSEVALRIYCIRHLLDSPVTWSLSDSIEGIVKLCSRGNPAHRVEERNGKLLVVTNEAIHAVVEQNLDTLSEQYCERQRAAGEWGRLFERSVADATAVVFRVGEWHERITDAARVERLVSGIHFAQPWDGFDYEMNPGLVIEFEKDGDTVASIGYVTYDKGARLRWLMDDWYYCARLTRASSVLLVEELERCGATERVKPGLRRRLFNLEPPSGTSK